MADSDSPAPAKPLSLKKRALTAGGWTLAGHASSQVLRLAGNLVMTRLLVPEAFGVMAIAMVITAGLSMFSDVGLKQNIVQSKRGSDPVFLNTAWAAQICRGGILFVMAILATVVLAVVQRMGLAPQDSAYADPVLPSVLAVMSVNFLIDGFQSTKMYEASRNLALARVTTMEFLAQVAGIACMLGWAMIDRSIWALVAGGLCWTATRMVLGHAYLPGTANRWVWDSSAFQEIFYFGKWIFLSSILGFLSANGDRLLLGGMLSTKVFGVCVIAFLIFGAIQQVLTKMISEVTFPAISEVARERPSGLKASYYKFHIVIGSFTYFCSGVLMMSGHVLIALLYDDRYADAGWMLEILAVALISIPFRIASTSVLALGRPKLYSNLIAIKTVSLYILVPAGFYFFGLPGALWGVVLSYFSFLPMTIVFKVRQGLMSYHTELLMLLALVAGVAVAKAFNLLIGY